MRKISGNLVSTKATTLSRAAEIVSRFAAVENGSSPAVALYLQRTAEAFNQLVHFHDKRSKLNPNLEDINVGGDLENKVRKKDEKSVNNVDEEGDDVEIPVEERKKKKKKRMKSDDDDVKEEESSRKKKKKKKRKRAAADS